ncbi:hypothetical protein B0J11DRAFT_524177 [Dendryphion nanum]|uniref:Uncharacterized protein n=1 Tax=Dendryphion nanum TaxID=256645 RepID=A0A9P9E3M0_9PLEO|nr:hypothetical protein B0J11DRAFT_524177 [Dendryphion nanum]
MTAQQTQTKPTKPDTSNRSTQKMANNHSGNQQHIPEHEIKQNSGVSASMALQAMQKAWDLRQAANAAGDPQAREEILAKAINKEIEAESFGKAAKYTRSGAFQGLAAGAGLGVQPGVTIGKITGALVGGVVSTVTGLLGGGIGSVYGAMNGPFWDLGEMASKGVRSIIGDFPNWKSTPAQKKALEKMVMQTRDTQAPTQEELEEMKKDAPDEMSPSWSQAAKDMSSWRPSMPSMPAMPSMPSMPQGAALGLGGLGASMPSWGGNSKTPNRQKNTNQQNTGTGEQTQQTAQPKSQPSKQTPKEGDRISREPPKPKEASTPKEAPKIEKTQSRKAPATNTIASDQTTSASKVSSTKSQADGSKKYSQPQAKNQAPRSTQAVHSPSSSDNKENKSPETANGERRKPRKLATKTSNAQSNQAPAPRKTPRKLEVRKPTA